MNMNFVDTAHICLSAGPSPFYLLIFRTSKVSVTHAKKVSEIYLYIRYQMKRKLSLLQNKSLQNHLHQCHYDDATMSLMASHITSLTIVYSTVYSGVDQRKHQSSASLAFVRGIHRGPVNSPHKWPVTRKMFPFDDVIMALPFPVM